METANDCTHMSATGIDTAPSGPGKVWACDHCGLRWRQDGGPVPGAVEAERERIVAAVEALRSALERTEANFIAAVNGRPVRDMAETLAENRAVLTSAAPDALARVKAEAPPLCPHLVSTAPGFTCSACGGRPIPLEQAALAGAVEAQVVLLATDLCRAAHDNDGSDGPTHCQECYALACEVLDTPWFARITDACEPPYRADRIARGES
jgi:hypothetical protein